MKTILLKFSGPLQSWGTSSHFENRHTDLHPSKSAVIGMLAACLGYRRNEDDKIRKLNEIQFAVRVDQRGNLIKDFQIARKNKDNGSFERNYVTNRYYLEDAVFVVAISHEDDKMIEEIYEALRYPYFQPFMGRRSAPLPYDFIIGIVDDEPIESLKKCDWQAAFWYKKRYIHELKELEVYADSTLISNGPIKKLRKDVVSSFSYKERKYNFRYETELKILNPSFKDLNSTEHDAFESVGE